jgi:hypothetical protein
VVNRVGDEAKPLSGRATGAALFEVCVAFEVFKELSGVERVGHDSHPTAASTTSATTAAAQANITMRSCCWK